MAPVFRTPGYSGFEASLFYFHWSYLHFTHIHTPHISLPPSFGLILFLIINELSKAKCFLCSFYYSFQPKIAVSHPFVRRIATKATFSLQAWYVSDEECAHIIKRISLNILYGRVTTVQCRCLCPSKLIIVVFVNFMPYTDSCSYGIGFHTSLESLSLLDKWILMVRMHSVES
jgi:hypothetical protein